MLTCTGTRISYILTLLHSLHSNPCMLDSDDGNGMDSIFICFDFVVVVDAIKRSSFCACNQQHNVYSENGVTVTLVNAFVLSRCLTLAFTKWIFQASHPPRLRLISSLLTLISMLTYGISSRGTYWWFYRIFYACTAHYTNKAHNTYIHEMQTLWKLSRCLRMFNRVLGKTRLII